MGALQSHLEADPSSRSGALDVGGKETGRDMREVDLISKAERRYSSLLLSMRDAYGEDLACAAAGPACVNMHGLIVMSWCVKVTVHAAWARPPSGDEDGYAMFKLVVLHPQKYQCDNRRLVQSLAREAISGLEGFGAAASSTSKLGILKSGLVFVYDALNGSGWREQKPGWAVMHRQCDVSSWLVQAGCWCIGLTT